MKESNKEKDTSLKHETYGGCCQMEEGAEGSGFCPMAKMLVGLRTKSKIGYFFLIPAALFFVAGVLILLVPKALVWLMGGISMLLGLAMLAVAIFLRSLASRVKKA